MPHRLRQKPDDRVGSSTYRKMYKAPLREGPACNWKVLFTASFRSENATCARVPGKRGESQGFGCCCPPESVMSLCIGFQSGDACKLFSPFTVEKLQAARIVRGLSGSLKPVCNRMNHKLN